MPIDATCRTLNSASLLGFADLAREMGLDPERLAQAAAVPGEALTNPYLRIPVGDVIKMLASAAALSGVEDLGLRLAPRRSLAVWGALALVMREQKTVRDVIHSARKYASLQNEAAFIATRELGDAVEVHINMLLEGPPLGVRVVTDLAVAQAFLNLREVVGGGWKPTCVCFRHARPRSTEAYRRLFGVDVLFGQSFDGLVLPRADLKRPIPGAHPLLASHVESYADQLLGSLPRTFSDQIVEIVILLLPGEDCTRERVAAAAGLRVRKMQRCLAGEGATFAQLLDEARRRLVDKYLGDAGRPVAEISGLLGFRSPAAFSAWFRGRFGESPSAWRRRHASRTSDPAH